MVWTYPGEYRNCAHHVWTHVSSRRNNTDVAWCLSSLGTFRAGLLQTVHHSTLLHCRENCWDDSGNVSNAQEDGWGQGFSWDYGRVGARSTHLDIKERPLASCAHRSLKKLHTSSEKGKGRSGGGRLASPRESRPLLSQRRILPPWCGSICSSSAFAVVGAALLLVLLLVFVVLLLLRCWRSLLLWFVIELLRGCSSRHPGSMALAQAKGIRTAFFRGTLSRWLRLYESRVDVNLIIFIIEICIDCTSFRKMFHVYSIHHFDTPPPLQKSSTSFFLNFLSWFFETTGVVGTGIETRWLWRSNRALFPICHLSSGGWQFCWRDFRCLVVVDRKRWWCQIVKRKTYNLTGWIG